jgi:flagellar biosynthetic protein FliP
MAMTETKRTWLRRAGLALAAAILAPAPALAESLTLDLGEPSVTGRIVQMVLLLTVLSLAPSILLMATSFTRIVVVLSLLRSALGLQQSPPNAVLIGLAMFLTAFIMAPTFDAMWRDGLRPMMDGEIAEEEGLQRAAEPVRAFMERHVRAKDLELFMELANEPPPEPAGAEPSSIEGIEPAELTVAGEARASLRTLIPAYMLSELRRAFEIGFLLFLPFLIIDLVIAAILTSMGMMMLPPLVVSLPFKLIFFVLVDGWWLVAGSLVRSYAAG